MTQIQKQNVPKLRFPGFRGEWKSKALRDFVDPKRKVTYGIVQPGVFVEEGIPLVRGGDYSNGWVPFEQIKRVTSEIDAPYKRSKLRKNDILLTIVGANTGTIAEVPDWLDGANITQTTARIAVESGSADTGYILQCLKSHIGQNEVRKYIKGAAQPGLNLADVEKFQVPALTLPEQRKIAGFLGAVDEKITHLSRKKALLEDYKKGCMQQLFSQEIRFKDDDGNDFPDWEEKRLGEMFSWVNTNSLSRERLTLEGGQVQNIHYGDIHTKFAANFRQGAETIPFIKDAAPSDFKPELFCQVGDVVMADASEDYADIGKAIEIVELGNVPLVAGLHTYIARPSIASVQVGFSGYLLRSEPMRRQVQRIAQGISVLGISKGNLEKLTFFLPHPAEQRKIADFLSALDRKIDLVAQELTHARAFKQGLLQQMFV